MNNDKHSWLFDLAPFGIYLIDAAGRIIEANPAAGRMTGSERTNTIGQSLLARVHPDDTEKVESNWQSLHDANSNGFDIECRLQQDDSRFLDIRLRCLPVTVAKVESVTALYLFEDRTHLKRQAQELDNLRDRLAHTQRLATVGEMAAGLAHELNQPLAAIATYAEGGIRCLEHAPLDPAKLRHSVGQISDQAHRAGEIVRKMRNLTRRQKTNLQAHSLNDVIRDIIPLIEIDACNHETPVSYELSPDLPWCELDSVQIQQVILNFVRNGIVAMEATNACNKRLIVRTERMATDELRASVSDFGPGVDPQIAAELSNPFFTTKPDGIGLGLSVCRSIVTQHGGEFGFYNHEDGGSCFWLSIATVSYDAN